jgi:hypothetical protein
MSATTHFMLHSCFNIYGSGVSVEIRLGKPRTQPCALMDRAEHTRIKEY